VSTRTRFPASLYRDGVEPDARFSLANERTFLAWIRSALALLAGGVALEALRLGLHPGLRLAASLVLILAGTVAAARAWTGWLRNERALRTDAPLPSPALILPLVIALVVVGILLVLGVVLA